MFGGIGVLKKDYENTVKTLILFWYPNFFFWGNWGIKKRLGKHIKTLIFFLYPNSVVLVKSWREAIIFSEIDRFQKMSNTSVEHLQDSGGGGGKEAVRECPLATAPRASDP